MKTALHRTGGSGGSAFGGDSGISVDDRDLVAYWKFDESDGYVIKDATGHGHDLHATSTPHWQVKAIQGPGDRRTLCIPPPPTGRYHSWGTSLP